ncbi:hypothetical protein GCM10027418_05110 [Mariniluteicoccus endophyticus]
MTWLAVALGGALGGAARFVLGWWLAPADDGAWPWGVVVANVLGSFVLGAAVALLGHDARLAFVGTGFCGALTTWSTFAVDAVRLLRRRPERGLAYIAVSLAVGPAAAYAGWAAGIVLGA